MSRVAQARASAAKARDSSRRTKSSPSSVAQSSARADWWPLGLVIAAALAVRIWALRFEPWVTVDGTEYIRIADALARGQTFPTVFPPGYPALIAIAHFLVPDRVTAAALVSLVAGTLLPWPVWSLARPIVGPRWALIPALVAALHPALIEFSTLSMSDAAYVTVLYAGLALAAGARWIASGVAMGAAYATRPEGLLLAIALVVRQAIGAIRLSAWRPLALVAAGVLVLAVPCWLYSRAASGHWTASGKLAAFPRVPASTWREDERRLRPDSASATPAAQPLPARALSALRYYPKGALVHGRSLLLYWPAPLLALSIWGLVRRRGIESIPLLHLLALPALGLNEQPRFVLSAVPALAILATIPLRQFRDRRLEIGLGTVWLAGAIWCGAANRNELVQSFDGYSGAQKQAGEWLARQPEGIVMDRRPHLAFYANRPYRVMPELDYDALLDYAVRERVRYLVLDEGLIRIFRPQLKPLLYDQERRKREPRVEMIYAGGHHRNFGVTIFRVLQPGESKTGAPPAFEVRWMMRPGATR